MLPTHEDLVPGEVVLAKDIIAKFQTICERHHFIMTVYGNNYIRIVSAVKPNTFDCIEMFFALLFAMWKNEIADCGAQTKRAAQQVTFSFAIY